MALAGALEIQLTADVARLSRDMGQMKGVVNNFAAGTERTLGSLNQAFRALGVGLSVGGMVAMFKSVMDAGDAAVKTAQKVGVGIEEWQKYEYAAKLAGVGSEQLAKGLKNMGDFVQQVTINSSESVDMMKRLGVSLRDNSGNVKTTSALLLDMADRFSRMPDGMEKSAAATKVFGKAGMDLLPFLNQGRSGIEALMREAERLGIVMDGDTARAAEALGDNIARLQSGIRGLVVQAISPLIPFLNQMVEGMAKSRVEGEGVGRWTQAATSGLKLLASGAMTVKAIFEALGNTLGGIGAAAVALFSGEFKRAFEVVKQVKQDNAGVWEKLGSDMGALWDGVKKGAAEAEKPMQKLGATTIKTKEQLQALKQITKELNEEWKRAIELDNARVKAQEDAAGAFRKNIEQMEFEVSLLGKSNAEREVAIALRALEAAGLDTNTAAVAAYVARIRAAVGAMEDYRLKQEVLREQASVWNELADAAGNFFSDLVMNGKSAFDNLKKWVKELIAQMIALFAKRWVLNLAAGGSVLGSAGNALAGGIGSDSVAGSLLTNVAGFAGTAILGTTGAGALGATAGGAFAQGAMGMGTGVWASGSAGAAGASLSGVYTALAAIPVWGWIAMAVIAIGAWIAGNASGGPKVGGSFFSGGAVPGTDNGRFFTPSQGDAQMQALVEATSRGYEDAISRLGGTAGAFNFGLGFDHDPQGSARSRVSSLLTDANGNRIYGVSDREMDDKEVEGALGLEMQRMIIAALQASDLQDDLDAFFDGIGDVSNLTGEQITALIAQAMELKAVIDALAIWDPTLTVEGLRNMAMEGETLAQTLQRVTQAQQGYYQLFFTAEENRARSMEQMRRQFQALGLAMPESNRAFRDLVEGIRDGTVEGDRLYNILLALSGGFAELYPLIEDTADVIGEAGETIRDAGKLIDAALVPIENLNPGQESLRRFQESKAARSALGDWIDDTLTGGMSPLDPMQKFEAARTQYEKTLKLAQGGDVAAISALGGTSDTYLKFAREMFASSGAYNQIFRDVMTANAGVAGISTADINTRLAGALPVNSTMASSADVATLNTSVNQLITLIASGISVKDPEAKAAIDGVKTSIERVGQKGALAGSEP